MSQSKKIAARQLRKGDLLEPDGTEVTGIIRCEARPGYRDRVLVCIREPGKRRGKTFMIDAAWPLHRRDA